ncbi:hypothetical protein GALLR39Z86_49440 [Glycomyces algeriensis]|uniref:Uncharacterized protein n=1 Tax=Glycomyces algeriensis TaxID=256037 RepID=A0A9W6GBN4_9ACTN|nr:hypothetical protein GALLR39Z86_49440 [Glycomyces algeriensis]
MGSPFGAVFAPILRAGRQGRIRTVTGFGDRVLGPVRQHGERVIGPDSDRSDPQGRP